MIWQGGFPDFDIFELPGPLVIVGLTGGKDDAQLLWHSRSMVPSARSTGKIQGVIAVEISDYPESALPDSAYLGLVDACCGYLRNGVNLYIHCRMGISRSTYLSAGIYMRLLNLPAKQAIRRVSDRRIEAYPNSGFREHLDALEERLRS